MAGVRTGVDWPAELPPPSATQHKRHRAFGTSLEEIDIWRTAQLLIDQHGPRAGYDALGRAGDLKASGDEAGSAVWMRVFEAIEALGRTERAAGESLQ